MTNLQIAQNEVKQAIDAFDKVKMQYLEGCITLIELNNQMLIMNGIISAALVTFMQELNWLEWELVDKRNVINKI